MFFRAIYFISYCIRYGQGDPILRRHEQPDQRDSRKRDRANSGEWHSDSANVGSRGTLSAQIQESHVYEDASNPGNQMLRKMGWTEGDGLGKDKDGFRDPVTLDGSRTGSDKAGIGNSSDLKIPPIDYGSGYKESLLRAAKARYDHLSSSK
jgi:RNA-binding protein 5/10